MLQLRLIKDQYTLIEQLERYVVFNMAVTNSSYRASSIIYSSKLMICLPIDVHMQLRYNTMYMMSC